MKLYESYLRSIIQQEGKLSTKIYRLIRRLGLEKKKDIILKKYKKSIEKYEDFHKKSNWK